MTYKDMTYSKAIDTQHKKPSKHGTGGLAMTDSDIIKAAKRCCYDGDCDACAYTGSIDCRDKIIQAVLDLIKRLQAENEKLLALNKKALWGLRGICKQCKKDGVCFERRGSHMHCWKWKYADFSVEMEGENDRA